MGLLFGAKIAHPYQTNFEVTPRVSNSMLIFKFKVKVQTYQIREDYHTNKSITNNTLNEHNNAL